MDDTDGMDGVDGTDDYPEDRAERGDTAMQQHYDSDRAPEPVGPYPHARRVGNLLFLSGIGPRARDRQDIPGVTLGPDGEIASYDIEQQCHAVFHNVRCILEDAGSAWENLVDITVYLTDMEKDFAVFNRVYREYFREHQPCRTTIGVSRLPTQIAIELKCIATI